MKTLANYRRSAPAAAAAWLPPLAAPRALDPSHWLSRAARGHSWNAAVVQRRRSH